ncbi:GNAT family N-acetyltransferase [Alkalicoccobacillus murimartini]|uniref:GNAT family N-acetyltransferase n=1 Tax=Alkalicoccobacillus murimartini TaxID=171685 RepID=UPI003522BC00
MTLNEKMRMRPLEEEDKKVFWELAFKDANPEWKKWDAPYYTHEALSYESFLDKWPHYEKQEDLFGMFVGEKLIGTVSFYWEHQPSNWLEAGIIIYDSTLWNEGYGTPFLKAWITHLFDTLPLVRVGFTTWSGNKRMMRLGEKLGMTLEARLRKCRLYQDTYYDSIRYGVLREEWLGFSHDR